MPRFVIQQHTCEQQSHWDLMLEKDQMLATWKVPEPPNQWSGCRIFCRHIFNHRLIYLTYEGNLTDNRGHVQIAAFGTYQTVDITENYWCLTLSGDNINGTLELQQLAGENWQLNFTGANPCQADSKG